MSVAESEEWIIEVAIGTSLHRIVFVVGQLGTVFVECDGKFTTGVIVPEEYVGHGSSTFLSRIPSLYDGITTLGFWFQSDSRTGAVHVNHLFASSLQSLEEITLYFGQLNVGTVATLETFYVNRHLLAFQTRCDTTYEDDLVDVLQLGDSLLIVDRKLAGHIDLHRGTPSLYGLKADFYLELLTLFRFQHSTGRCGAPDMVNEFLLTIDVEFKVSCALHIHYIFPCFFRCEGCLIFGREIIDGQVGGEYMHAGSCHVHGFCVVFCGEGFSLHFCVGPEGSFQAFLAAEGTLCGHTAVHHLVVGQVAAREIDHFLLFGAYAVKDGDGVVGCAIVITPHHRYVIGIGTDDSNLFCIASQGQNATFVL